MNCNTIIIIIVEEFEIIGKEAVNSIGGACFFLNEISDENFSSYELIYTFEFASNLVESVERFDQNLGTKSRFVLNRNWSIFRTLLHETYRKVKNKVYCSTQSVLSAIGLLNLSNKKKVCSICLLKLY